MARFGAKLTAVEVLDGLELTVGDAMIPAVNAARRADAPPFAWKTTPQGVAPDAINRDRAEALWAKSEELVGERFWAKYALSYQTLNSFQVHPRPSTKVRPKMDAETCSA